MEMSNKKLFNNISNQEIQEKYGIRYLQGLSFSMKAEGGYANHINDNGGMTWAGIARTYNSGWKGWQIIDKYLDSQEYNKLKEPSSSANRYDRETLSRFNSTLSSNKELVMLKLDFYYHNYFKRIRADIFDNKISIVLFDISILQGVGRAVKTLQRLCNRYFNKNLVVDGIIGNMTVGVVMDCIKEFGEDRVVSELLHEYLDNLIEASKYKNNAVFLDGWTNRVKNLRNFVRLIS